MLKWQSKKSGIQYQLSALPLGGYVKMLDEREGNVAEQDLPYAFNRQSPWKRIAIVAAGPLINLIFAVLLFWILFFTSPRTAQYPYWQNHAKYTCCPSRFTCWR